ncbi:hypothetical protein K7W42_13555 [Deinococcus sp. HMF7604]|uniref:hypothetical protein n=1 Tax=Deinococcus betulae TaxID=2873312 RepID=UPI001CC950D4|nr:hypothetical protein [Deinococcus betulae]MBZ9751881.1 hypothetical protein [Deinococcus betulae]
MTTAAKRRKLEQAEVALHAQWVAAWTDWAGKALREWARIDPDWKRKHDALFQPLYEEWASAVQRGEEASFLAIGALLAKWWESAPELWAWLWRVMGYWLAQDLRCWPSGLEKPPKVPSGMVERLAAEAESGEDVALLLTTVVIP